MSAAFVARINEESAKRSSRPRRGSRQQLDAGNGYAPATVATVARAQLHHDQLLLGDAQPDVDELDDDDDARDDCDAEATAAEPNDFVAVHSVELSTGHQVDSTAAERGRGRGRTAAADGGMRW